MTRRGAPPAPGTIEREIALLKRCINYAVECGTLVRNPIASVSLLNEPNTRDMILKPTIFDRVLEAAPPAFAPVNRVRLRDGPPQDRGPLPPLGADRLRRGLHPA